MAAAKIPTTIEELRKVMANHGVSDDNLDKFEEELEEGDHDIESIKEDISEREQSMLLDFFRDDLHDEKIYDIVKAIMDGTPYNKGAGDDNKEEEKKNDTEDDKEKINKIININKGKGAKTGNTIKKDDGKQSENIKKKKDENKFDPFKEWELNKDEEQSGEGTVILNAGLIIIPDDVITNEYYLENIEGITYVLAYNNAKIRPPRLPYSYIDFWKEYLNEEEPKYKQIMDDISHNEGPTYDYLMEHPPNDRILPVLEKVVDQLKHPILDSNKEKRAAQTYHDDINEFFRQQTPDFYKYASKKDKLWSQLIKTCIIFKKNTNDTNFNIFELFVNIQDIYDRILYDFNRFNLKNPQQITGIDNITNKHHFVSSLNEDDCSALNETLINFKNIEECQSFFGKLERNPMKDNKINDNLQDFQCISLSFMLFIKAFMSETGNCLETGYHIYKAPKSKKGGKKQKKDKKLKEFQNANYKSLSENKCEKNEGKDIEIDDNDIFFHNDNFPLQFDLCIIPKSAANQQELNNINDYGLDSNKYNNEFGIESKQYKTPNDRHSIYKLYGDMVEVFRKVIINKNNIDNKDNNNGNNKDKKEIKRRDDRYCIVFNQNINKFYMYPPHINNGDNDSKITHRKNIKTKKNEDNKDNKDNGDDINNSGLNEEEKKQENEEEKVRNKYSLIAHEYNDLTNFYLTSKCIIPSKSGKNGGYYGINKINFVLSAHFHKQRQWHRHPKLRIYQYFNGGGLRFFYSNKQINNYIIDKDIINLWPIYFNNIKTKINHQFIQNLDIFDAVMNLYKCDAQYFQWDNAIKRQRYKERR